MKGDIAVAGFMLTAEEWQALDAASRAQLVAVITRQGELAAGSGPIASSANAEHCAPPDAAHRSIELIEVDPEPDEQTAA